LNTGPGPAEVRLLDGAPALDIRYASSQEEGEEGNQFEPFVEEVFLGFVIYPQEQGEVQLEKTI